MSRRRRGGPSLKIIKWRDIPAQVNASSGDDKVQIELPHRFQAAIDRAAMLADKKDSNSYIAEMGQEVRTLDGDDLKAQAEQLVADIEAEFTMDRLNEYVRNGGFAPDSRSGLAGDGGAELGSDSESADSSSGPAGDGGAVTSSGPAGDGGAVTSSGPAGDGGAVTSSGPAGDGGADLGGDAKDAAETSDGAGNAETSSKTQVSNEDNS